MIITSTTIIIVIIITSTTIIITITRQLAWATPVEVEEQVGAGNKDLNHKWRGSRSRTGESTVQATKV